jgi:hypothetical protein
MSCSLLLLAVVSATLSGTNNFKGKNMEIAKNEIAVVEAVIEQRKSEVAVELSDLELAYVGGGIGDIVGH